ncbi:NmrA family NAD(P)-binding protein [Marinilongibacter aquaticus]|uniref:NmrA family NAD(P)-binding protein n=1 Tax=Marinilongibacter aquaticus TaxID=2975157 RepID=UPI0021BDBF80|nr:NmrA family NAD(P)-binding protein [Marinilongibacter aquaticus]UBM60164.1 NmrA family NAD(P)-binding protein [Marinilongibacter aquaticus]
MKIIVTGSLGHISKPLTKILIEQGHDVLVISHTPERQKDIEALGAKAAIGSMEDVDFLSSAFQGADLLYAMEAVGQKSFFTPDLDFISQILQIGENYKEAIQKSGIKQVIHLSSIGGHTDKGNGMLRFHHHVENTLNELPAEVQIKFMRPVGFYYNMFAFIPTIKAQSAIIQNYGGDEKEPWVSPLDIAEAIAEEIEKPFMGRQVRYIASDEASPNEVAKILGEAIGKPELHWLSISDEQFCEGLLRAGMNKQAAEGLTEMNAGRRGGKLYADYALYKPQMGRVKLKDFAKDFAAAYKQN